MNPEKFLLDFIESVGNVDFDLVIKVLAVLFGIFWLFVIGWVWSDAGDRSSNPVFKILSVGLVAVLNIPGLIIYLILRPKQTIAEIYWSDLERRYLRYETAELGDCFNCGFQLQPGFVHCPNCASVIKVKCTGCEVFIDKGWKYCPFCSKQNSLAGQVEDLSEVEMEKRVKETRKHVVEKVESHGTRYAPKTGFAVQVGDAVLGALRGWGERIDSVIRRPAAKKTKKSNSKK
jgi:hypothetical protein